MFLIKKRIGKKRGETTQRVKKPPILPLNIGGESFIEYDKEL